MLINRYKTRESLRYGSANQAIGERYASKMRVAASTQTTCALPRPDMELPSSYGNTPVNRSPRMAHKPTAIDQSAALPADRSTSFIDIQLIAQAFARFHQLSGNDGGQCMMPGISSSKLLSAHEDYRQIHIMRSTLLWSCNCRRESNE